MSITELNTDALTVTIDGETFPVRPMGDQYQVEGATVLVYTQYGHEPNRAILLVSNEQRKDGEFYYSVLWHGQKPHHIITCVELLK